MDGRVFKILPLALIVCLCNASEPNSTDTLRMIHAFFRHGDRTALKVQPDLPLNSIAVLSGDSQLTYAGKNRLYKLGQRFRNLYSYFIPQYYSDDFMYMYSTGKTRTLTSAQLFLAGLYPPKDYQVWLEGMNWQPTPVHTEKFISDPLYPVAACDKAYSALIKAHDIPEVKQKFQDNMEVLSFLENKTGLAVTQSILPYIVLMDRLKARSESNLTMPEWAEGVYPEKTREMAHFMFPLTIYTYELKRLRVGPMLNRLVTSFENYRNGVETPKLHLYSVHDVNIMYLGYVLQLFLEPFLPEYGVILMFELHEHPENNLSLKIKYINKTNEEPMLLVIPGCTEYCPLDYFVNVSATYIPDDWKAECQMSSSAYHSALPHLMYHYYFIIVMALINIGNYSAS